MKKPCCAAFSLVEVSLALGIAGFCLVALLGLVPIGLTSNRNAVEQTAAAGIAASVIADIRNQVAASALTPLAPASTPNFTPRYKFDISAPLPGSRPHYVYVSEDGTATAVDASPSSGSRYKVTVGLLSPVGRQPMEATPVRIMVTWPPLGTVNTAGWPTINAAGGAFETTVAINLTP
jgi:uncharacterized protein (TIGR02598 family)